MKNNKRKDILYVYPDPDRVEINEADLKLKLVEQNKHIRGEVKMTDFLLLVSIWAILFTAELKDFWMIPGKEFRGVLFILVLISTAGFICKLFKSVKFVRNFLSWVGKKIFDDNYDPDHFITNIKKICVNKFL